MVDPVESPAAQGDERQLMESDHWDDSGPRAAGGVSFANVQFEDITFEDVEPD